MSGTERRRLAAGAGASRPQMPGRECFSMQEIAALPLHKVCNMNSASSALLFGEQKGKQRAPLGLTAQCTWAA